MKGGRFVQGIDGGTGETLHLYCLFISPDEKQLSMSQYVRLQGRK